MLQQYPVHPPQEVSAGAALYALICMAFSGAVAAQTPAATSAKTPVASEAAVQQLQRVELEGSAATDTQLRRDFVAGKIVISRRSIEESGVGTVLELLRREPAVTISNDGRLGLLGLPGYTQILVDGKPPAPGRSAMETELVHVDRIEIVKGSLAEYGPFGIAGTINIVSRRVDRKPTSSLRFGGALGSATRDVSLAWSETVKPSGSAWSISNRLSLRKRENDTHQRVQTRSALEQDGPLVLTDLSDEQGTEGLQTLTLSSSAAYKFSEHNSVTLSPSAMVWRTTVDAHENHQTPSGEDLVQSIPEAQANSSARMSNVSLPVNWKHETSGGSRMEIEFSPSRTLISRQQNRREQASGESNTDLTTTRATARRDFHAVDALHFTISPKLGEDHAAKLGVKLGHLDISNKIDATINGEQDPTLALFGTRQSITGPRHSAYVQDEWTINKRWAATAGVTSEWRKLHIVEGQLDTASSYRVTSPSLHLAHKLDAAGDQRLRLSWARSFRAPEAEQLTQRPTINPLAPCSTSTCGANRIEYADTAGNSALQPERSTGWTLSYEHSFGKDSLVSLDGFRRQIKNVMGEVVDLESVSWASAPRYIIRPQNLGQAWTHGFTAEARAALSDLFANAPKLEVRAGATLAQSRLETLPGPDNHLADQSPWSAKLGGRYQFSSMPMELSIDANWTPGRWYRTALDRRLYQGRRQDISAQASWAVNPGMKIRLSANNLLARDSERGDVYGSGSQQDASVWTRKDVAPSLAVTVEMKL
jgi:outer membrane receptor for ferrienterochelin and colicins